MLDSTSFPDSHNAYAVPVASSTTTPPGTVLQPDPMIALVSVVIICGGPNVLPPSVDMVTYASSSGLNVWYSRKTVVWSGSHGVPERCGYTSIHGRSDAPGW